MSFPSSGSNTPGTSVPMSQFFVATPSSTAAQINAALAAGCNLLFTPGVYSISQTINVTNPNTVVLGLGFPTLVPTGGVDTMHWAWRADHGNAGTTGWTVNTAQHGLVVNGTNVLATGLFVEHYQNYDVQWFGNGGETMFFQNEMPYDPPSQAAWMNGSSNGYAAYEVGPNVTTHQAYGLGSYCYFNVNPAVVADHAFEAPATSGVQFHDIAAVSLGNVGAMTSYP